MAVFFYFGLTNLTCQIMRNILFFVFSLFIVYGCRSSQSYTDKTLQSSAKTDSAADWALLPFEKLDSVNPVLQPGAGSFIDPIRKAKVLWEEKDVFNPAIVQKGGKIYMFY